MNKVFSLFMICAMAVSLTAADTLFFNRYQFQPGKGTYNTGTDAKYVKDLAALTVPFVYSGNLKLTGYGAADDEWINYELTDGDCFVGKNTLNVPIYMTICQPCLDCYPCTVLGQEDEIRVLDNEAKVGTQALVGSVTRWNLYLVEKWKDDDRKENVTLYKVNLMTTQNNVDSVFFTGRKGSGNDSNAFAQYRGVDNHGYTTNIAMMGKKNDYKFNYTVAKLQKNNPDDVDWVWEVVKSNGKEVKETAYIKSPTKFDGVFCVAAMYGNFIDHPIVYPQFTAPHEPTDYNQITKATYDQTVGVYYGFQFCGEIKLTRNASMTKAAITGAFGVTKPKAVSNWEDCDEVIPANYCEQYFKADPTVYDKMDEYLEDKVFKSYEKNDRLHWRTTEFVDEYLADFWEDEI